MQWALADLLNVHFEPSKSFAPLPTPYERAVFWALAILSMALGPLLAWGLYTRNDPLLFLLTGVVHAFAFGGLLWFVRLSRSEICLFVVACVLFPFWGWFIGACGFIVFSTLTCSAFWGAFIWSLLRDRRAFFAFCIVGVVPSAPILLTGRMNGGVMSDLIPAAMIGYWHVAAAGTLLWLGFRRRAVLAKSSTTCSRCDYSLSGLPSGALCPECGRDNTDLVEVFSDLDLGAPAPSAKESNSPTG